MEPAILYSVLQSYFSSALKGGHISSLPFHPFLFPSNHNHHYHCAIRMADSISHHIVLNTHSRLKVIIEISQGIAYG